MSATSRALLQFLLLLATFALAVSPYSEFIFLTAYALGWNSASHYHEDEF